MKKFLRFTKYLVIALITLLACTKDVDVLFSFPFDLTKSHDEIATINYKEPTLIRVVPERVVSDNVYQFSYVVTQGEGFLRYAGQEPLMENTEHTCESFELDFEFIGTEIGIVKILFSVKDIENQVENIELTYNVIHNSFEWDANAATTNVTINEETPLTLLLNNTGEDQSVTYVSNITFTQGSGTLHFTDNNGNSTLEVEQGESYDIEQGVYLYNLTLDQTGVTIINFKGIDSNGQIKEDVLTYNVDVIDYTYNGAAENNSLFIGESTNINQEINEISGSGDTYNVRYEFITGSGNLSRQFNGNQEVLLPGVNYPVEANAYYWSFEALSLGMNEIKFYAINESGVEREITVNIEVINGAFDFNAIPTQNFGSVNDNILINFDINETGPEGSPYTMFYETSSNGEFVYDGISYLPGAIININSLNFSGSYTGLNQGNHEITFTVINSYGDQVSDLVTLLFNEDSYVFTAASEQQDIILNGDTDFNFNIADNNSDATYQIYYTVSGNGNGELSNGSTVYDAGVLYNVNSGAFSWDFSASSIGNLTYTFVVENNSGVQQTQIIDITINSIPDCQFNFTSIASNNTATVGDGVAINFNVNSTVQGTNYTMIYTTSEAGVLSYNGTDYTPGQSIDLGSNPSSFVATYSGSVQGAHDLEFTITCDGGTAESQNISIMYQTTDFSLSTVGDGTLLVNELKNMFAIITQNETDPSITYEVQFSIDSGSTGYGEIFEGANNLIYGVPHNINIGNNQYNFKGINVGDVTVNVQVTDSNGVSHVSSIDFIIETVDFTFVASVQDGTIELGESTNVYFNISETVNSGTNYVIKYEITSSETGQLVNAGTLTSPLTDYPISLGASSWVFNTQEVGNININFTVTNVDTLQQEIDNITIIVDEEVVSDFTFTATPTQLVNNINNGIGINFNIIELVPGGSPYIMTYTSDGFGYITIGGTQYYPGSNIPVNVGAFSGIYTGESSGSTNLTFTVTNNNTAPISKQDDVDLTFETDFVFNANAINQNLFINESSIITLNVSEIGQSLNANYLLSFNSILGGGTFEYDGTTYFEGQSIPITIGASNGTYTGVNTGIDEITFSVVNDNTFPINHSDIVTITYSEPNFSFDANLVSVSGDYYNNIPYDINFEIIQNGGTPSNYSMDFTVNGGTGTFIYDNVTYNAGDNISVPNGQYLGMFEAFSAGNYSITFNVTNNNSVPITNSDTINFTVLQGLDFTFTANHNNSSSYAETDLPINFNITPIGNGTTSYEMFYSTSQNGTFTYNGIVYNPGDIINVIQGNFSGFYTPNTPGSIHTVEFTVNNTATNIATHSDTVSFTILDNNFTYTICGTTPGCQMNGCVGTYFGICNFTEIGEQGKLYRIKFVKNSTNNVNITLTTDNGAVSLLENQWSTYYADTNVFYNTPITLYTGTTQGPVYPITVNLTIFIESEDGLVQTHTDNYYFDN